MTHGKKEAAENRDNWGWMKYSMHIAIKVRAKMKAENITQTALAKNRLHATICFPSSERQGKSYFETIAKLESALDISLFGSSPNVVDG